MRVDEMSFAISFLKVNSDYKVLKGEKFELVSYDKTARTGLYTTEEEYGDYHLRLYTDDPETISNSNVENLLPSVLKNQLESVRTRNDISVFQNYSDIFGIWTTNYSNGREAVHLNFYSPNRLEHIKAAPGTQKKDIIFLTDYSVSYTFDSSGNLISSFFGMNSDIYNDIMIYDADTPEINSISDLRSFTPESIESACMNTDNQGKIITDLSGCTKHKDYYGSGSYYLVPYFVAKNGEVKFEIQNTVNNVVKYNASKEKGLKYKVSVTNTGNAASDNNIITAYLPKEITIIESTITDNGVYNRENHTITWTYEYMEEKEKHDFYYEATAPAETNGKELITNASVKSNQVLTDTYSNNTIVTLDKIVEIISNPKTGTTTVYIPNTNIGVPINILLLLIVALCVATIIVKSHKKKAIN